MPGTASYGVALLSRYPALSWQVLHLPRIPVRFPLYLPTPRKVVVVHEEPRAVVIGQLETPAGPGRGRQHPSVVRARLGRRQLFRIRRDLSTVEGPVLLMGDLNMAGNLPTGSPATVAGPAPDLPARPSRPPTRPHPAPW